MKLYNNTPMEAFYGISDGTSADCGNIPANQTTDLPYYNNKTNVTVTFTAVGTTPPPSGETTPFSATIPATGTGMTVTIGLYQE
jgi:hypothetical protein